MKNDEFTLIRQFLEENHIYEELPDKAVHKLSYLVYQRAHEHGLDVSLPYFWYRYGVLTQQPATSTSGPVSPGLDATEEELLNQISETVLEKYYDTSLREITDLTYKDAPYEVFRHWRELDKQISRLQDNYNPFFDNTPIREEIEDKIERVYDSFPLAEYPHHEADIATWYFGMTRELDMGLENVQRLHDVNTVFWGIFTLSVAEKHHYNMTREEVLQALGITSFAKGRGNRRKFLAKLEREGLDDRFDNEDSELTTVTDAMVEPVLESL